MATWNMFYDGQPAPVQFDFHDIAVTACAELAFATAMGRCSDLSTGQKVDSNFASPWGSTSRMDGGASCTKHHSVPLRPSRLRKN